MLLPAQNCCYVGYKCHYDSLQMDRRSQVGTILGTSHAGQLRKTHRYLPLPTYSEDIRVKEKPIYLLLVIISKINPQILLHPTCSEDIRVKYICSYLHVLRLSKCKKNNNTYLLLLTCSKNMKEKPHRYLLLPTCN